MKLIVAFFLTATFSAHAENVLIANLDARAVQNADRIETAYVFDQTSGEASAKILVYRTEIELRNVCTNVGTVGNGGIFCRVEPRTTIITVLKDYAKIPNVRLEGDTVTYYGAQGSVVCGVMKPSRIFRLRTLFLNGNCSIQSDIVPVDGTKRLKVSFVTK